MRRNGRPVAPNFGWNNRTTQPGSSYNRYRADALNMNIEIDDISKFHGRNYGLSPGPGFHRDHEAARYGAMGLPSQEYNPFNNMAVYGDQRPKQSQLITKWMGQTGEVNMGAKVVIESMFSRTQDDLLRRFIEEVFNPTPISHNTKYILFGQFNAPTVISKPQGEFSRGLGTVVEYKSRKSRVFLIAFLQSISVTASEMTENAPPLEDIVTEALAQSYTDQQLITVFAAIMHGNTQPFWLRSSKTPQDAAKARYDSFVAAFNLFGKAGKDPMAELQPIIDQTVRSTESQAINTAVVDSSMSHIASIRTPYDTYDQTGRTQLENQSDPFRGMRKPGSGCNIERVYAISSKMKPKDPGSPSVIAQGVTIHLVAVPKSNPDWYPVNGEYQCLAQETIVSCGPSQMIPALKIYFDPKRKFLKLPTKEVFFRCGYYANNEADMKTNPFLISKSEIGAQFTHLSKTPGNNVDQSIYKELHEHVEGKKSHIEKSPIDYVPISAVSDIKPVYLSNDDVIKFVSSYITRLPPHEFETINSARHIINSHINRCTLLKSEVKTQFDEMRWVHKTLHNITHLARANPDDYRDLANAVQVLSEFWRNFNASLDFPINPTYDIYANSEGDQLVESAYFGLCFLSDHDIVEHITDKANKWEDVREGSGRDIADKISKIPAAGGGGGLIGGGGGSGVTVNNIDMKPYADEIQKMLAALTNANALNTIAIQNNNIAIQNLQGSLTTALNSCAGQLQQTANAISGISGNLLTLLGDASPLAKQIRLSVNDLYDGLLKTIRSLTTDKTLQASLDQEIQRAKQASAALDTSNNKLTSLNLEIANLQQELAKSRGNDSTNIVKANESIRQLQTQLQQLENIKIGLDTTVSSNLQEIERLKKEVAKKPAATAGASGLSAPEKKILEDQIQQLRRQLQTAQNNASSAASGLTAQQMLGEIQSLTDALNTAQRRVAFLEQYAPNTSIPNVPSGPPPNLNQSGPNAGPSVEDEIVGSINIINNNQNGGIPNTPQGPPQNPSQFNVPPTPPSSTGGSSIKLTVKGVNDVLNTISGMTVNQMIDNSIIGPLLSGKLRRSTARNNLKDSQKFLAKGLAGLTEAERRFGSGSKNSGDDDNSKGEQKDFILAAVAEHNRNNPQQQIKLTSFYVQALERDLTTNVNFRANFAKDAKSANTGWPRTNAGYVRHEGYMKTAGKGIATMGTVQVPEWMENMLNFIADHASALVEDDTNPLTKEELISHLGDVASFYEALGQTVGKNWNQMSPDQFFDMIVNTLGLSAGAEGGALMTALDQERKSANRNLDFWKTKNNKDASLSYESHFNLTNPALIPRDFEERSSHRAPYGADQSRGNDTYSSLSNLPSTNLIKNIGAARPRQLSNLSYLNESGATAEIIWRDFERMHESAALTGRAATTGGGRPLPLKTDDIVMNAGNRELTPAVKQKLNEYEGKLFYKQIIQAMIYNMVFSISRLQAKQGPYYTPEDRRKMMEKVPLLAARLAARLDELSKATNNKFELGLAAAYLLAPFTYEMLEGCASKTLHHPVRLVRMTSHYITGTPLILMADRGQSITLFMSPPETEFVEEVSMYSAEIQTRALIGTMPMTAPVIVLPCAALTNIHSQDFNTPHTDNTWNLMTYNTSSSTLTSKGFHTLMWPFQETSKYDGPFWGVSNIVVPFYANGDKEDIETRNPFAPWFICFKNVQDGDVRKHSKDTIMYPNLGRDNPLPPIMATWMHRDNWTQNYVTERGESRSKYYGECRLWENYGPKTVEQLMSRRIGGTNGGGRSD